MNSTRILVFWMLAGLTLTEGCNKTIFGDPVSQHHQLLKKETRNAQFFTIENIEYQTHVAYKTEALRRAYVNEYAKKYQLPPDKKEELLRKELEEASQYDVFLVSHFSGNSKALRLSDNTKVWRLTLSPIEDPLSGVEPTTLVAISRYDDPVLSYFYPFITHWSSNFIVKFKKTRPAQKLYLRMAGVLGNLLFTWDVEEEQNGIAAAPHSN